MAEGERILVYGVTGSGKSTLAAAISTRTGLPWHCMDDLTWEPGWIQVAPEEQRRRVANVCAGERWIIDTAYSQWLDIVLARTDTIVALDYPRWVSLGRLLRRTLMRLVDRRPICNGNTEMLRQALSRNSIIVWHFRSFSRKRARIRAWAEALDDTRVIRMCSPRQTERWLTSLSPHLP